MNQSSLFENDAAAKPKPGKVSDDNLLSSVAEVRELAREFFGLPPEGPPALPVESPLLKAKREQAARESGAHLRGMVAKWAPYETAKGHISIHDPDSGEWYDVVYKEAPGWAKWEARRRTELYKASNCHAYDLTSAQMHEIWKAEHTETEEGIVEDHPLPE